MPHGDQLEAGRPYGPGYHATHLLLDAAEGDLDGPWVDVRGFARMSVDVAGVGAGTGQVVLYASNWVKSLNGFKGHQLGPEILDDGITQITATVAYVRAALRRPAGGPKSPVTVILHAVA